ncbi:hypothetical protein E3N88_31754 [Mikania micrantha]|uniref:Uncharacterized protein n=1 Tax=Mikania micrantha TaxID=192012 RepID=A0A5N6M6F7_9ASTR|nr:hypothetical protein E3N88_31754 [Mikania micrantha]
MRFSTLRTGAIRVVAWSSENSLVVGTNSDSGRVVLWNGGGARIKVGRKGGGCFHGKVYMYLEAKRCIVCFVDSISYTCDKSSHSPELFPRIDPMDAYYVLNPGGDLKNVNRKAKWFRQRFRTPSSTWNHELVDLSIEPKT